MIPNEEETPSCKYQSSEEEEERDEVMMAGYKECAKEALTWLLNLGYEPGHPLIRSLAAHLTKKQAYLEKLNLEHFLIREALRDAAYDSLDETEMAEGKSVETRNVLGTYDYYAHQIKNDEEIQRSLVDAVFRGCNLQYEAN